MTEIKLTLDNPRLAATQLGHAANHWNDGAPKPNPIGDLLLAIQAAIEEQVKPAVEEPTGDVVVFFSARHPRQRSAWTPDDGMWGDGGPEMSWAELVGDGKPDDVMLYRRFEYPEVGPFAEEEIDQQLATANRRLHGQIFCRRAQNCRLADGHADGCSP